MYYYIYDSFLSDKRYERVMAAVETRLTDLGITGRIGRLTPFTNARGLVRDETRRGASTIVVVGNDETLAQVVGGIGEASVTLGIIPVGSPTVIAKSLGIPDGADACDVLSRRVTQKVDLGKINGQYFLSEVRLPPGRFTVEGEGQYRISTLAEDAEIVISNLRGLDTAVIGNAASQDPGDPQDGFLDVLIVPQQGKMTNVLKGRPASGTVIPLKRLTVRSDQPFAVVVDGRKTNYNEVAIEIAPGRLKVITGIDRLFADE